MRIAADGDGSCSASKRTGQAARIDGYGGVPGWNAGIARDLGLTSGVGAPIITEGRVWGAITVLGSGAPLPANAEARLGMFAKLVAMAIANAQAQTAATTLADEQAALRRVAELVARGVTPEEVFAAVATEASRLLDGEADDARRGSKASTNSSSRRPVADPRRSAHGSRLATRRFRTGSGARIASCASTTTPSSETPSSRPSSASRRRSPRRSRCKARCGEC